MKKSLRKRIRIRSPALVALLVLLGILAGTIPAYAWSDSGLPILKDTPVTVTGSKPWQDNKQWYYIGVWTIHVSGAKNGTGQVAMGQTYKDPKKKLYGEGYCFVDDTNTQAIEGLNGNPTFVNNNKGSHQALLNWGSGWDRRTYIGYFLELCGAQFLRWEKGHVYVRATEKPNANLTLPSTIRTGQSAKIGISGSSFVPSDSPYRNISWVLKVNGSTVDSGQGSMSFNKQVSHTFTSANSTVRLEVTDGVGRTTVVERNASGQSPPTPPPPPTSGGSQGPVADFSMPRNAEIGEAVTITDMSYHPGGGTIIDRQWMLYPNDYTGYLSGTGSTLRFNSEGTYDVMLIVKDNNNRMDSAEKQIHIGPPPPPPPPPEPENDPPVARFTMPSVASPGETVNVVNESYDPDGYLTVIQWNVTPSSGVTNNLGDFGGTLIFDQTGTYEVEVFVVDDFGDYDEYSREISIENQAPVAKILAPDKALQGEDIEIKSASYDPDGTIEKITWSVEPNGEMVGTLEGESSTVYFDKPGTYTITLTVEDNHGEKTTATAEIEVLPAVPQAFFVDNGPYKQNRKLTFTEQGISTGRYPIVKEQNEWQITPVGNGATAEAIKIKNVAPDQLEALFRTAGDYKVSLRVTNSAGNKSEWYERTFSIVPDRPPVADFAVTPAAARDVANDKKATIMPRDTSYSPDGDIISKRIWKYRYDSNNDGNFEDESWVIFSNANEMTPSFETDQVGRYQIELEVTEEFGEETLEEFITPNDYLKNDTSEKLLDEKRVEVINMAPMVSFQAFTKHIVDVVVAEAPPTTYWEFNYTGYPQTITLTPGTYLFEVWGAQGGDGWYSRPAGASTAEDMNIALGGKGGYAAGQITLTQDTTFYVYVGERGANYSATGYYNGTFNGGGGARVVHCGAGSGGGATDIRLVGGAWNNVTGLRSRIITAGGGGGAGESGYQDNEDFPHANGGAGGNLVGGTGGVGIGDADTPVDLGGAGGTQTSGGSNGGSFGIGGSPSSLDNDYGGGGGGYYGGGLGTANSAGGGGSSFISGHPGCDAVDPSGMHTGQPNHYSGLVFTETRMETGVRNGHGYARITQLNVSSGAGSLETATQILENQLENAGLDAKVTYCDTTVLDSNSADAATIFNTWVNFPGAYGDWEYDSTDNILYSPTNPTYETGFYDPNNFSARDMAIKTKIKADQPYQEMGLIFKLTPTRFQNGYQRYDAYFLGLLSGDTGAYYGSNSSTASTALVLFKVKDYRFGTDATATPLSIYRKVHGGSWYMGWPYEGHEVYGHLRGFPHDTPLQNGFTVTNVVDPLIKTTIMDHYVMPYIDNNTWYDLEVEVQGNKITIHWNGNKIIETIDPDIIPNGTYGVFQFSHIMPMFKDIVVTTQNVKPLDEVVKSNTWRENSHKFVLDVNNADYQTLYLNDPVKTGELFSRLLSLKADLSVLGKNNQESALQMIALNQGEGAFFTQTEDNVQPIQDYGQYIINKVLGEQLPAMYVLLNEQCYYETFYSDPEEDPKYAERWQYNHDETYFENSLGKVSYDGQWVPTPVYRFDKVGKFNITFQAQDNPKDDDRFAEYRKWSYSLQDDLEIYVHRKPVASFKTTMNPAGQDNIVFTENFESTNSVFDFSGSWTRTTAKARSGSWSYRSAAIGDGQSSTAQFAVEVPAGATNAKLSFYYYVSSQTPSGCDYGYDTLNIYLDGAQIVSVSGESGWVYVERALSAGTHTVKFEYIKDGSGYAGSDAGFVDDITLSYLAQTRFNVAVSNVSAYDLDHFSLPNKGIVEHKWSWKPPTGIAWTTGAGPPSLQVAPGQDYLLCYEVKDMEGAWSDPFVVLLTATQRPPIAQFKVSPNPVVVGAAIQIHDMSYDPNGDPIVEHRWRVRHNTGGWGAPSSTPPASFDQAGTWEIELMVKDSAGLWSESYTQTVTVLGNTRPVARFTVSPNPAYDYETLYYEDTSYDPDGDPIGAREWRVSKDGGAWQYYAAPPTTLPAGNYVIELRVQDIPQHPMLEPLWSEWYGQTLTVKESFEIVGQVTPNPAERGRKIRITAYAQRIGTGEKIQISEVKAYIPHPTKPDDTPALPGGTTPVVVNMSWDNAIKGYVYDYLLPDKTVDGRWTDDGTYYIRVVGKQGEVEKEALLPVQIRGHILQRVYIRTDKW